MTNNVRDGPSLPQARNSHVYRHLHSHQQHAHGHLPRDSDGHSIRSPSPPPPPVSPPPPAAEEHAIVENRQEFVAPEPVVVVQTVSVLQIVDGSGAIIEVSTLFPDNPVTLPVAQIAETLGASLGGVAVSAAAGLSVAISPSLDLPTPTLDDGLPSSTDTADTVHVTNSSLSLSPPDEATLTSAPSTSITPQASLPAAANVTTSPFTNGTLLHSLFANSTTSSLSSSTLFSSTTTLSSTDTSDYGASSVEVVVVTATAGAGGGAGDAGATSPGAAPTTASGSTGLPKQTQNAVIGGIVGGVAAIAILVMVAMVLLRWKRRSSANLIAAALGPGGSSLTGRSLPSAPGDGGSGSGAMAERGGAFLMPAALASLTGQRRASRAASAGSAEPSSTGETGFYRVSGRKLAPVILSGGDGYSDPDDSMTSRASIYRDSHGFFSGSGKFQLGSPMRPESGIPIVRSGPGRTAAVQELGPFSDYAHPLAPPPRHAFTTPSPDPIGRSLTSQNSSRGSGSRFTEDM